MCCSRFEHCLCLCGFLQRYCPPVCAYLSMASCVLYRMQVCVHIFGTCIQPYDSLGLGTVQSSRLAFGGLEKKEFTWSHSLLYLAILNKFSKKKPANPTRPLQLLSGSTYAVKKEKSQSDCTKKTCCKILNGNNRINSFPDLKEKSFTTRKKYYNQVLRKTIDPHTYKFCNCTERPGVTGRVGMQELWTKLKQTINNGISLRS